MKTIGFIGVGELALYTIKGLRRGGYAEPILLSPRNVDIARHLQREFDCRVQADNQAVVDNADFVFIATRPEHCIDVLSALEFKPGRVLVSVVAGIETEKLRTALPSGVEIVRAMPVSSAEVSASPTLIYPDNTFVGELFDYCGSSIPVDNEAYFTQGNILACVYSWYLALFDELIRSTSGPELPAKISGELVMGMAKGAAELALANRGLTPAEIADGVATDGTYSKLGLDLLQKKNAFKPWREACELLASRLAGDD